MKKIMFTGGGSAGHVTVNLALIPRFEKDGWSVVYVGSKTGIEKQLVAATDVKYIGISSGKLRRYFDWKNFKDPFKVAVGVLQAYWVIRKEKPSVLFSKGGFVSVPVVIGAWMNKVPIVIHESDITPGLANRIAVRFAERVCTTFQETEKHLPTDKSRHVGAVIREEMRMGTVDRGRAFCQFPDDRPTLLVVGGSLGAKRINETVRAALSVLTQQFNVVHLCGKGNLDPEIRSIHYRQYEYLSDPLPDVMAMADVVISRAGSNSIFELLYLRKPMLLIPLPKGQSRGDQILNAGSFEKSGFCKVLQEDEMTVARLVEDIGDVYEHSGRLIGNMRKAAQSDALSEVMDLINEVAKA